MICMHAAKGDREANNNSYSYVSAIRDDGRDERKKACSATPMTSGVTSYRQSIPHLLAALSIAAKPYHPG